ncbi:MAG TPA: DUF3887 domain-containing protein [Mycobacteriales bacterium]|nr:DUF3887 domain-containing protein [Mycobacteriales bacterium]
MTDLETALRAGLHDRLADVDLPPGVLSAVPARAARIRRRRAAVLAGATSITLLVGISAAVYLPRGERDASSVDMVDDGTDGPARSDLSRRAEDYARKLAAGDYAGVRADMTDNARGVLTEARLRMTWRALYGRAGGYGVADGLESVTGTRAVASVVVQNNEGNGVLHVVFDDDDRVTGLLLVAAPESGSTDPDPAVSRSLEIVRQLGASDFTAVRRDFDETMRARLPEKSLASTWRQVERLYGPVQGTEGHLVQLTATGHRVVDVVTRFSEGVMKVRVAFDPKQRVAGLFVLVLDA